MSSHSVDNASQTAIIDLCICLLVGFDMKFEQLNNFICLCNTKSQRVELLCL